MPTHVLLGKLPFLYAVAEITWFFKNSPQTLGTCLSGLTTRRLLSPRLIRAALVVLSKYLSKMTSILVELLFKYELMIFLENSYAYVSNVVLGCGLITWTMNAPSKTVHVVAGEEVFASSFFSSRSKHFSRSDLLDGSLMTPFSAKDGGYL